jgi:hypothetical protein
MLWLSTGLNGVNSTNIYFQGGCDGYVNGQFKHLELELPVD